MVGRRGEAPLVPPYSLRRPNKAMALARREVLLRLSPRFARLRRTVGVPVGSRFCCEDANFNSEGSEDMRRFSVAAMCLMSVAGLLGGVVGCDSGKSDYKKADEIKKAPAAHDEHDHDHGAKGPHGGSLVELGAEQYHAEIVLDHDAHALRVFLLGPDAKTAASVAVTELAIAPEGKDAWTLKAVPQEGDGDGKSSRFELIDDAIVHDLLDAKFLHGDLRITIGDTPFSGHIDMHLDEVHHDHKDEAKPAAGDKPVEAEPKADAPKTDADAK